MTDRFHSLTVVLVQDIREDDAEALIQAICMLRGVVSASGNVSDPTSYMAEQRARRELEQKLLDIIHPKT